MNKMSLKTFSMRTVSATMLKIKSPKMNSVWTPSIYVYLLIGTGIPDGLLPKYICCHLIFGDDCVRPIVFFFQQEDLRTRERENDPL